MESWRSEVWRESGVNVALESWTREPGSSTSSFRRYSAGKGRDPGAYWTSERLIAEEDAPVVVIKSMKAFRWSIQHS